jgi:hypothetical protein
MQAAALAERDKPIGPPPSRAFAAAGRNRAYVILPRQQEIRRRELGRFVTSHEKRTPHDHVTGQHAVRCADARAPADATASVPVAATMLRSERSLRDGSAVALLCLTRRAEALCFPF